MQPATRKTAFARGLAAGLPFVLAAGPFGMVFGIAAVEAGLDLAQLMAMSLVVFAGAAQFTALAQMDQAAPVALVVLAGLAVNLRMAMYSASLAPHFAGSSLLTRAGAAWLLVDNTYATGVIEFERAPKAPLRDKLAFYAASAIPVMIVWPGATLVGAALGARIPETVPTDFAMPVVFLALVAPMVKTLPHLVAAMVSVIGALVFSFLPYSSGLLVAAGLAMVAGVQVEERMR